MPITGLSDRTGALPTIGVATRISGEITEPGAFTVQSASEPGIWWPVEWISPRTHHCPCPGFTNNHRCRHVTAVFARIAEEWAERRGGEQHARKETP